MVDMKATFARWESERVDGKVVHGSEEDQYGSNGRMCDACQAEQDRRLALFWATYNQEQGPSTVERYEPNKDRKSYPGYPVTFAHGGAPKPTGRKRKRRKR